MPGAVVDTNPDAIEASRLLKERNWAQLIDFIETRARSLSADHPAVLKEIIERLPQNKFGNNPWILYWKAFLGAPEHHLKNRRLMKKAFQLFVKADRISEALSACAWLMESQWLVLGNHYKELDPYLRWIATLNRRKLNSAERAELKKISGVVLLALTLRNPASKKIPILRRQAESIIKRSGSAAEALPFFNYLLGHYVMDGDYRRMKILLKMLEPFSREEDRSGVQKIFGKLVNALALLYTEVRWQECLDLVQEAFEISKHSRIRPFEQWLLFTGAVACLVGRDIKQAEHFLKLIPGDSNRLSVAKISSYHVLSARKSFVQCDFSAARSHFQAAVELSGKLGFSIHTLICHVGAAIALVEESEFQSARRHLNQACKSAAAVRPLARFMIDTAQSYLLFKSGNEHAGIQCLRSAFTLGKKQSVLMTPVWCPSMMAYLCGKALQCGIHPGYASMLIRKHRLDPDFSAGRIENWPWSVRIYTLGRFEVNVEGAPLQFTRKLPKTPLAMLKMLVTYGEKEVPEAYLCDVLWPGAEGDAAHRIHEVTLARLRRLLGKDALLYREGRVSLNNARCWVDLFELNRTFEQSVEHDNGAASALRALQIYHGDFLPADNDFPGVSEAREKIKNRFVRLIVKAGTKNESSGMWEQAAGLYQRGIEVDPLAEELYQRLLICYRMLGRKSEAVRTYHSCVRHFRNALQVDPSDRTKQLLDSF